MEIVIVDNRISKEVCYNLLDRGFEVIPLPPYNKLKEPVSAHPDMLIFILEDQLFTDSEYYAVAKDCIDYICQKGNLNLVLCNENIAPDYPFNIAFNILKCGKKIFCKRDNASKTILKYALDNGYSIINVAQGYTKCSVCKVSDKAIITADKSIAKNAQSNDIEVLLISEGGVCLPPYDYGFIGGASGLSEKESLVYFCGDLNLHKDHENIINFCKKHNCGVVSLSSEPLYDVGTLIFLN